MGVKKYQIILRTVITTLKIKVGDLDWNVISKSWKLHPDKCISSPQNLKLVLFTNKGLTLLFKSKVYISNGIQRPGIKQLTLGSNPWHFAR